MRKHADKVLRIACIALGALLIFQVVRIAARSNPLAKVSIPDVPTLAKGTNTVSPAAKTNSPASKVGTNVVAASVSSKGTNAVTATNQVVVPAGTNGVVKTGEIVVAKPRPTSSSSPETAVVSPTNTISIAVVSSNASPALAVQLGTNAVSIAALTNNGAKGSNVITRANISTNATNALSAAMRTAPARPDMAMRSMPGMPGGKPVVELSPANRARVDRIYESELFGQVMRPMPAALMGIAGNMAMLRSSSGQTGLVKEGDSLGEMKLLQIGVNRVLVEEKGEKKELMIFNGYGGESLLSKKESSDETTKK